MWFPLPWTPHRTVRHAWTRLGAFTSTTQSPSGRAGGWLLFWRAYARAQWWKMVVPHSHIETILQSVWGHQLKALSGIPPSPAICLVLQVCLSSCILRAFFWQFLHYTLICSLHKGFPWTSLLLREAERRVSGFYWEDVNYAGDWVALMVLYWHLCPNLRKSKPSRHLQFCFCFYLDLRKTIIPMSWVMRHWSQTGVNFEEHPMSLELFALPQWWFHKHRMNIRSERFTVA